MRTILRTCKDLLPRACLFSVIAFCIAGGPTQAAAQSFRDGQAPKPPLVLKAQGSFMIGGETVFQSPTQLSSAFGFPLDSGGHVVINQMYVRYMIPLAAGTPVVLVHGSTLSGKSYETTPDGRMGWDEYFVRRGHAVYVPDQVSRARSGMNTAIYNDVRAGILPASSLPNAFRNSNELNWKAFRFGPSIGVPFADQQFPVAAADELAKQAVPDFNAALPMPNPNYKALSDLAVRLKGAVVIGHSQAGTYPLEAALTNPTGMKGLALIEPVGCSGGAYTDQQIATLATIPILVVYGDHLDADTGIPGFVWQSLFDDCKAFIARVNAANGNARMLHPPELGIYGNSHMIMQDKNNLQIADLILKWIDRNVARRSRDH